MNQPFLSSIFCLLLSLSDLPGQIFTGGAGKGDDMAVMDTFAFTFDGGVWDFSPNGFIDLGEGSYSYAVVQSGIASITENTQLDAFVVKPDAKLEVSMSSKLIVADTLILEGASAFSFASYKGPSTPIRFTFNFQGNGWHNIGLPIGAEPLSVLGEVGTDFNPNTQNLFYWDAAQGGWQNIANGSVLNVPGRGYVAFFGTNGVQDTGMIELKGSSNDTIPAMNLYYPSGGGSGIMGALNGNDDNLWNLVANPFPCSLIFFNGPSRQNVASSFAVYDPSSQEYLHASPIMPTNIAPFQSFWVSTIDTNPSIGPFYISNHCDVNDYFTRFYKSHNTLDDILIVQARDALQSNIQDNHVIALLHGTHAGFDPSWDAIKKLNAPDRPSLFGWDQEHPLAHNAVALFQNDTNTLSLPLGFMAKQNHGSDYIMAIEDSLMLRNLEVYLEDQLDQSFHNLVQSNYRFTYDSSFIQRFTLHLKNTSTIGTSDELIEARRFWINDHMLYMSGEGLSANMSLHLRDIRGRVVYTINHLNNDQTSWEIPAIKNKLVSSGIYILELSEANAVLFRTKILVH